MTCSAPGSIVKLFLRVALESAMAKAAAVKGIAAQDSQPALNNPVVAKAALSKAPRCPPARRRGARAGTAAATAAPRPKQTAIELQIALADAAGLAPKDAKRFLEALRDIAATRLREDYVFKLHDVVIIRMRKTRPRNAVTKAMFGKEVVLPAKPAGHKITASAVRMFYNAVNAGY